jgi:iron complex outermembrane recepter protein
MHLVTRVLCGVSAFALLGMATANAAESASAGDTALDEVVVTARKRVENVQDVPATVAVLSAQRLKDQNITSIYQMREIVPGLQMRRSVNGNLEVKLRGLGTATTIQTFEQSVGAFTDGAYIGHTRAFNTSLFDIERIEIIKGTQAALLGKNTSLGAISVTTRRPGKEFAYDLNASYEFEQDSDLISGGVDVPLSDTFRIRLAGQRDHRGGWVHNIYTNVDGPDRVDAGARLTAVWEPSSNFDVTASYTWTKAYRHGAAFEKYLDTADVVGGYAPFNVPGALSPFGAAGLPGDTVQDYKIDTNDLLLKDEQEKFRARLAVLNVNYTLDNGVQLTSLTAIGSSHTTFLWPNAGQVYYLLSDWVTRENSQQYSQEFRITSPTGKRIEYQAGVYLARDKFFFDLRQRSYGNFATGAYNAANPPPPFTPDAILIPQPLTSDMYEPIDITTDDAAVFGAVTFNVNDKLSLNVSGRYTYEKRKEVFGRFFYIGVPVASPFPGCLGGIGLTGALRATCATNGGALPGYGKNSVTGHHPDGSLGVNYKATDDVLLYATYAKGTKGAAFANFTAIMGEGFAAEVARTSEVGVKSTFRDLSLGGASLGDVRFNLGAFHTTITGLQAAIVNSLFTGDIRYTVANRNVKSDGADLEFNWRTPVERLEFTLMTTYVQARYRNSPSDPTIKAGTPPPGAPLWSGTARIDYSVPLSEQLNLKITPSVDFRSRANHRDYTTGPSSCASDAVTWSYPGCLFPTKGYQKLNLRVGIENTAANWELALIGRNLNNTTVFGFTFPSGRGWNGTTVEEPRTIAVQFSLRH